MEYIDKSVIESVENLNSIVTKEIFGTPIATAIGPYYNIGVKEKCIAIMNM